LKKSTRQLLASVCLAALASPAFAQQVSAPAMIQLFESRWTTLSRRAPDMFMAGYGGIWIPPAGRADTGNQSVGYDVYDRFDLGNADNPTLYGTERTLKSAVSQMHRIGVNVYADTILNHDGFNDQSNSGFVNSGGYPGFVMSRPGAPYGDFHAPTDLGTNYQTGRLAGLIDIAQESNFRFVRNPLPNPVDANGVALTNLPAGTTPYFGKLANVPIEANRRFYQDRNRAPDRMVFNPTTGQADIPVWDFTADTATTGDAIEENATQYLMRNTQWMLQEVGVDGFRLDAVKHFPASVLNDSFDLAVYRGSKRQNLDGSTRSVFTFGEAYDGDKNFLQTFIRKDINPADPGRVGGNRDVLDMPLFFAIRSNLTENGLNNDWRNVVNASQDSRDDGNANNGSQGVAFVTSHDDGGEYLSNVAHAYTMMRPGNALVYFNAEEFGTGRDFPQDGRGDALGGQYGSTITMLTNLRNTHGRGNYLERWLDKETLVYERDKSAVVALNNRGDNGFDARTVQTNFLPGTRLIEMTGNAADASVDPTNAIADFVVVDGTGKIAINVPRNKNTNGVAHNKGYVIYGLPTPSGTLSIPDRANTITGGTPTPATNGTTRLAALEVVTGNTFTISLNTSTPVIGGYTDVSAGGDGALFSINGGLKADGAGNDLNGNGQVDFRDPSNNVVYGFEAFTTKSSPLVGGGDGQFRQIVDATKLVEGFNYLEVRAFRARPAGEPAVYSSFKKIVYVDRLAADSALTEVRNVGGNDRALRVTNADQTADNVHAFLDIGAAITDAQLLAMVNGSSNSTQIDADLWSKTFSNVGTGNHIVTLVTYEPSGRSVIKRLTGQFIQTGRGLGLGDVNYDNAYTGADSIGANSIETYLYSRGQQFNAAADLNADGLVDNRDLLALPARYASVGAAAATIAQANSALTRRANVNGDATTSVADIDFERSKIGQNTGDLWLYDLDVDGSVTQADFDLMITNFLFTRPGDANLDRTVSFADLVVVAQNYNQSITGWAAGDFSGNGIIGFEDLISLAQNYNFGVAGLLTGGITGGDSTFAADWALAQSLVPEPTSLTALIAAVAISRHRRD
jgi:alpha-amylase